MVNCTQRLQESHKLEQRKIFFFLGGGGGVAGWEGEGRQELPKCKFVHETFYQTYLEAFSCVSITASLLASIAVTCAYRWKVNMERTFYKRIKHQIFDLQMISSLQTLAYKAMNWRLQMVMVEWRSNRRFISSWISTALFTYDTLNLKTKWHTGKRYKHAFKIWIVQLYNKQSLDYIKGSFTI